MVPVPKVTVVSHEIGQYDFFPDFGELERYEGVGQPLYLEIYKERLKAVGLYEQWKEFFEATGKFAIDCYKRELESALLPITGFTGLSGSVRSTCGRVERMDGIQRIDYC